MFTKGQILHMKEEEFQNSVLIPLFRAMKYRDVTDFGGRTLERGKDIVMWKEGDFGERINYGVVIKAKKITGNAETNDGAMNVLNQVRQMLKNTYINSTTGEKEQIHRCIVACSKHISKEAMYSIEGELDGALSKVLIWLHPGSNLFEYIEKYMPEQSVIEQLSDMQEKLDAAMKLVPYKIVIDTDKHCRIIPKHERAFQEFPLFIKTEFDFDQSLEAQEIIQKLNDHISKGSEVEIENKFIKTFELPEFIPEFIKPMLQPQQGIKIFENKSLETIPIRIVKTLKTGETIRSDILSCFVIGGMEEARITNDEQHTPLKFNFILNTKNKTAKFNLRYVGFGFNVYEHLKSFKFFSLMAQEGKTEIFRDDLGLVFPVTQALNETTENFDKDDIFLLENLYFIQQKTNTLIDITNTVLSSADLRDIDRFAKIIRTGKLDVKIPTYVTEVSLQEASNLLKTFANESVSGIFINYSDGMIIEVFGKAISSGKAVVHASAFISKQNYKNIEDQIKNDSDSLKFIFNVKEENLIVDFLDWECEDRHLRYDFKEPEI